MSGLIMDRRHLRMDSCIDDPQGDILLYYKEGNVRRFVDLLGELGADVNKSYPLEQERTLLQIAVEENKEIFVKELLRNKLVDPNIVNLASKKTPLVAAVEKGYESVAKLLIDCGADVNYKGEDGSTPLHVAAQRSSANWLSGADQKSAQRKFLNIVRMLLDRNVNADAEKTNGLTPLFSAAEKGTAEVTRALLNRGCNVCIEVGGDTPEDFIKSRFPQLVQDIRPENRVNRDTEENKLFKALYNESRKPGVFLQAAKGKENINWESTNGKFTFLQFACDNGFDAIVDFLLDAGANPNGMCNVTPTPPLVLAGHHGYHKVIKVFKSGLLERGVPVDFSAVEDRVTRENVLHKILKAESMAYVNRSQRNYGECLNILLREDSSIFKQNIATAINGQSGVLENTPLHIAAQLGNHEAVKDLLRAGANIGLKNNKGETPVVHIAPDIMEEFLDDCLVGEGQPTDDQFKLTFSYSFLGPPVDKQIAIEKEPLLEGNISKEELPETEPLWYMSQIKEHRNLLTHPVITSFLWLKWKRIRQYFYMNLAFYTLFLTILTAFIILENSDLQNVIKDGSSDESIALEDGKSHATSRIVLRWMTLVLTCILTVREIFQFFISVRRYIFSLENIGEVLMLTLIYYLIFSQPTTSTETNKHISGIVILLSWTEFVLLMGRHPRLSTFITMFGNVSWNFASFLLWYLSFIIAFGLCFFIIFSRPEGYKNEDGEDENGYFAEPSKALFKTIIMSLTGEIEFEDIGFRLDAGRLIFLLYVFFIMLVLINLLNGLAINEISEIRRDAEIVCCAARIELISYIESILLGDPFGFLINFPESKFAQRLPPCNVFSVSYPCFKKLFRCLGGRRFLLFSDTLRSKTAEFRPNLSKGEVSGGAGAADLKLSQDILEAAKALHIKKNTLTDTEEMKNRLKTIENMMFDLTD